MIYEENIKELKKAMNINEEKTILGKHNINNAAPFLPFTTRNPERPQFRRKFSGVTGELFRLINQKELSNDFEMKNYIDEMVSVVKCNDEEDRKYLRELIKERLIDKDGEVKVFHPSLFNYIEFTEGKESIGEKNISQFIYDVIFNGENTIIDDLDDTEINNIITRLILFKLEGLNDRKVVSVYRNNLEFISKVAQEDFLFIAKHKEFFLKNVQSLMAYYYFYYITQFAVKINKKLNGDYSKPEELYYLLDWEKASKNRRSEVKGYKYIKSESRNLLININIIEHLNFLFGVRGKNFKEIKDMYDEMPEEEKNNYIETIEEWIIFYRKHFSQDPIETKKDLEELIGILQKSLLERIDQSPMSRYTLFIEEIGKKYFLKTRGGAYGYMLNISQEMILVLTAVSIKEDKITLKTLFKEYERRGLFLDQQSQDLVSELLGKLNLIDKKSDSGDAQYVKSIL